MLRTRSEGTTTTLLAIARRLNAIMDFTPLPLDSLVRNYREEIFSQSLSMLQEQKVYQISEKCQKKLANQICAELCESVTLQYS